MQKSRKIGISIDYCQQLQALQDTNIEGNAVWPRHPHWSNEKKADGQAEAGRFAEVCGAIAGEDKT
jgi:hypothetical protein